MKLKPSIYLAGPMEGCTIQSMTEWREAAAQFLTENSGQVHLLDPCRREPFHNGDSDNTARLLFRADLKDINSSDLVLANVRHSAGRGSGTSMELMYAWMRSVPLFLWVGQDDPPHPFHTSMATFRHHDLSNLCQAARDYLEI